MPSVWSATGHYGLAQVLEIFRYSYQLVVTRAPRCPTLAPDEEPRQTRMSLTVSGSCASQSPQSAGKVVPDQDLNLEVPA